MDSIITPWDAVILFAIAYTLFDIPLGAIIYPPRADAVTDYNKAIYWLITTIATVGCGDITPNTNGGRIGAICIMFLGATIWGILIASASRMIFECLSGAAKKLEQAFYSPGERIINRGETGKEISSREKNLTSYLRRTPI